MTTVFSPVHEYDVTRIRARQIFTSVQKLIFTYWRSAFGGNGLIREGINTIPKYCSEVPLNIVASVLHPPPVPHLPQWSSMVTFN